LIKLLESQIVIPPEKLEAETQTNIGAAYFDQPKNIKPTKEAGP
jgi:hypothetical protein